MARYKSGSVYVIVLSIICFVTGMILFYYGSDRILILGSKTEGRIIIGKYDLKLYFLTVNEEYLDHVNDIKFRTEPNENKSLVSFVRILSPDSSMILIGTGSKIDDRQKRDIYNDLDFFIRNNRPEYKKTLSFITASGGIGIFLSVISFLTFFSMILSMINRVLVEKDRTKFTSSSRLVYALVTSRSWPDKLLNRSGRENKIESAAVSADPASFRELKKKVSKGTVLIECPEDHGTAASVNAAKEWASGINGDILLLTDPLANVTPDNISSLLKEHTMSGNLCTALTSSYENEMPKFFQISRNTVNKISDVSEVDKTAASENPDKEYLTGIFCFELRFLFNTADKISRSGPEQENIAGFLNYIIRQGTKTGTYNISENRIQK